MKFATRVGGWLRSTAALTLWTCTAATATAGDGPFSWFHRDPKPRADAGGTLGYGPAGRYPGFQGFGLAFHRGYGYGGDALGVGAGGGYPFYGGPGYPHSAPQLNRFKRIAPFPYYGGPGGPTPVEPHFYDGGTGPLVNDRPVVATPGLDHGGYGAFSGMMPYPDSAFAPDTTRASGESSSPGVSMPAAAPDLFGSPNP